MKILDWIKLLFGNYYRCKCGDVIEDNDRNTHNSYHATMGDFMGDSIRAENERFKNEYYRQNSLL